MSLLFAIFIVPFLSSTLVAAFFLSYFYKTFHWKIHRSNFKFNFNKLDKNWFVYIIKGAETKQVSTDLGFDCRLS